MANDATVRLLGCCKYDYHALRRLQALLDKIGIVKFHQGARSGGTDPGLSDDGVKISNNRD